MSFLLDEILARQGVELTRMSLRQRAALGMSVGYEPPPPAPGYRKCGLPECYEPIMDEERDRGYCQLHGQNLRSWLDR